MAEYVVDPTMHRMAAVQRTILLASGMVSPGTQGLIVIV